QVPPSAPFFADHFPRRPVFPGSLLMHLSLQLGAMLVSELRPPASGRWGDWMILDMKLRSFIPPGTVLELDARLKPQGWTGKGWFHCGWRRPAPRGSPAGRRYRRKCLPADTTPHDAWSKGCVNCKSSTRVPATIRLRVGAACAALISAASGQRA